MTVKDFMETIQEKINNKEVMATKCCMSRAMAAWSGCGGYKGVFPRRGSDRA